MLHKPTSPYPYQTTVVLEPKNKLMFSCEAINSNVYSFRIKFDNFMIYQSAFLENDTVIENIDGVTNISCKFEQDKIYSGYTTTSNGIRRGSRRVYSLGTNDAIIKSNGGFTWQIRLYENAETANYIPSVWVAYGVVEENFNNKNYYFDVSKTTHDPYIDDKKGGYYTEKCRILKIRPHDNLDMLDQLGTYYINIDNVYYKVLDFIYYDPTDNDKIVERDSYGTPLYGYIIYSVNDYSDNKFIPSINSNSSYTIFSNFIDSDVFYFNTMLLPELHLYDMFEREILGGNTSVNSVISEYSNYIVTGQYISPSGSTVVSYKFSLEQFNKRYNEYIEIYTTGTVFSSDIKFNYDMLLHDEKYRLTIITKDSNGFECQKELYINTDLTTNSLPLQVWAGSYYPRGSRIIDFSNLLSIQCQELYKNHHKFMTIDALTGDINETTQNAIIVCDISLKNELLYSSVENLEDLQSENASVYLQFKISPGTWGEFMDYVDDSGWTCRLVWNGVSLDVCKLSTRDQKETIACLTGIVIYNYCPYEKSILTKSSIIEGLMKSEFNTTVPWKWFDDLEWKDDYFWHEETPFSNNWWRFVGDKVGMYLKNVSVDSNYIKLNERNNYVIS